MAIAATIDRTKYDIFRWRYELSIPKKFALAVGMAALIGLVAQIRIPLPFTLVPITGQTFAVLLAGVLLGSRWGGISLGIYAGLGAIGLPWFAGWSGGFASIAGPTGGYIVGFVLAALFMGYFTDRYIRSRSFLSMMGLMLFANFVLIHGPGLLWLSQFPFEEWLGSSSVLGLGPYSGRNFLALLMVGTIPFIIGDVIKAAAAAAVARAATPKQSYGAEVDKGKWASWRLP